MAKLRKKDIQEIIKIFEHELNLLIRMDRFEKMELRKKIHDVVLPLLTLDIARSKIFMDVVEDKLHDVFDLFIDGYEFRKKLARKIAEKIKSKPI